MCVCMCLGQEAFVVWGNYSVDTSCCFCIPTHTDAANRGHDTSHTASTMTDPRQTLHILPVAADVHASMGLFTSKTISNIDFDI